MNWYILWLKIKCKLFKKHYWEDHIDYLQCRFCKAWHTGETWCFQVKNWVDDEFCGEMCDAPCWEDEKEMSSCV